MRETATRRVLFGSVVVGALVLGACAHRTPSAHTVEPVALAVIPRLGLAPRDVSVTARIERDSANREACLAFLNSDGAEVVKSCHTLDGANAPRFWQHIFDQIEAGSYSITLDVTRNDGHVLHTDLTACYSGEFVACGGPSEVAP